MSRFLGGPCRIGVASFVAGVEASDPDRRRTTMRQIVVTEFISLDGSATPAQKLCFRVAR